MSYPQKLDLIRGGLLLIHFGEDAYRSSSFLDDRILGPATRGGWVPVERVVEAAGQLVDGMRPLHFIFHTGHVGSTLVSRLLDETGQVLSLREPLPLRTLAEAHDVLHAPESLLGPAAFRPAARDAAAALAPGLRRHTQRRRQGNEQRRASGARAPRTLRRIPRDLPQPACRARTRNAAGWCEFPDRPARTWGGKAEAACRRASAPESRRSIRSLPGSSPR